MLIIVLLISIAALGTGFYLMITDKGDSDEMKKVDVSDTFRGVQLIIIGLVCLAVFILLQFF